MKSKNNQTDLIAKAYENARVESVHARTQKTNARSAGTRAACSSNACNVSSAGSAGANTSDPNYTKVVAPAKVNLYLAVGERQENGYHPVENVMHTLLMHDVLYMRRIPSEEAGNTPAHSKRAKNSTRGASATQPHSEHLSIHLTCSGAGNVTLPNIPAEENIVYKAITALWHELGRAECETLDVHLEKHIPHQAGLGGGSSDAAAALVGAAYLWGVSKTDACVERVARTLGADVAYFLQGGCALFNGVGNNFVRSMQTCNSPVVLLMPQAGLSTAQVYEAFDKQPCMAPKAHKSALSQATRACDLELFNALAPAACSLNPELEEIHAWAAAQLGVTHVLLTGSGSCTYAVCETTNNALAIAARAQARGWWAACTYFANIRATTPTSEVAK